MKCIIARQSILMGPLMILGLAGAASGQVTVPSALPESGEIAFQWRTEKTCGLNCLFVMLRLGGRTLSYPELYDRVLLSDQGVALADLRDQAGFFGLACSLAKTDPAHLEFVPTPFIAHTELLSPSGKSAGHYVLVLNVTSEELTFMDGTTAVISTVNKNSFVERWTGYILHETPRFGGLQWGLLGASCLGGCATALAITSLLKRHRHRVLFISDVQEDAPDDSSNPHPA